MNAINWEDIANRLATARPSIPKSWLTGASTSTVIQPDVIYARLCGAKKRKNRNIARREVKPDQIVLVLNGEYFVRRESSSSHRDRADGKLIETRNYFSASKKTALKTLRERQEKDFADRLEQVARDYSVDV